MLLGNCKVFNSAYAILVHYCKLLICQVNSSFTPIGIVGLCKYPCRLCPLYLAILACTFSCNQPDSLVVVGRSYLNSKQVNVRCGHCIASVAEAPLKSDFAFVKFWIELFASGIILNPFNLNLAIWPYKFNLSFVSEALSTRGPLPFKILCISRSIQLSWSFVLIFALFWITFLKISLTKLRNQLRG